MNKTWLIIKREYITRVRNRTFIISTFLTPMFFVGLIAAVIFMTPKDKALPSTIDDSEIVKEKIRKNIQALLMPSVTHHRSLYILSYLFTAPW